MELAHEYIAWALLAIIKFIIAPSLMIGAGYSWLTSILTTSIGAAIGLIFFYHFAGFITKLVMRIRKRPFRRFTRVNRFIVRVKQRFGLVGFCAIAVIISVPVAAMIASRLFREPAKAIPALILGFLTWSFILTSVSYLIRQGIV